MKNVVHISAPIQNKSIIVRIIFIIGVILGKRQAITLNITSISIYLKLPHTYLKRP